MLLDTGATADDMIIEAAREVRREESRAARSLGLDGISYADSGLGLFEFGVACDLAASGTPVASLIAAALMRGDSSNIRILSAAYPVVASELRRRLNSGSGMLPGEEVVGSW